MAGERCPDCRRELAPREVMTKGWHKNPESCGARLHPTWAEQCIERTVVVLRARLALAETCIRAADEWPAAGIPPALVKKYDKARDALEAFDRAANPETERGTPVANAQETAAEAGKPSNR